MSVALSGELETDVALSGEFETDVALSATIGWTVVLSDGSPIGLLLALAEATDTTTTLVPVQLDGEVGEFFAPGRPLGLLLAITQ